MKNGVTLNDTEFCRAAIRSSLAVYVKQFSKQFKLQNNMLHYAIQRGYFESDLYDTTFANVLDKQRRKPMDCLYVLWPVLAISMHRFPVSYDKDLYPLLLNSQRSFSEPTAFKWYNPLGYITYKYKPKLRNFKLFQLYMKNKAWRHAYLYKWDTLRALLCQRYFPQNKFYLFKPKCIVDADIGCERVDIIFFMFVQVMPQLPDVRFEF